MFRQTLVLVGLCAAFNFSARAADAPSASSEPNGHWLTESHNLEIEVAPTSDGLTGTVSRVLSSQAMGDAKAQATPADPNSLIGLKILQNLVPSGKNEWKGHIFNRDNGKTYDCVVTFVAPDELDVRGYSLIPLFGKTQVWHRVVAGAQ